MGQRVHGGVVRGLLKKPIGSVVVEFGLRERKKLGHLMFFLFCGVCLFLGLLKICATGWFGSAIERAGSNQVGSSSPICVCIYRCCFSLPIEKSRGCIYSMPCYVYLLVCICYIILRLLDSFSYLIKLNFLYFIARHLMKWLSLLSAFLCAFACQFCLDACFISPKMFNLFK